MKTSVVLTISEELANTLRKRYELYLKAVGKYTPFTVFAGDYLESLHNKANDHSAR